LKDFLYLFEMTRCKIMGTHFVKLELLVRITRANIEGVNRIQKFSRFVIQFNSGQKCYPYQVMDFRWKLLMGCHKACL